VRLLITGAAGFIGSSLVERLLARGDEIVGLDAFDELLYGAPIKRRNLEEVRACAERSGRPGGFHLVEGDLLDPQLVDRLVGERPDAIVHLGALAGVRPSIQHPKRYQRTNVEGTLNLLEAARAHHVGRFVFASSSSVYGAHSPVPFREEDPCGRPASPYAATKRCGELLCSTFADLYPIATVCLRFFTVYGPRQRPEMAIHKFTRLIHRGQPVPLFGDGQTARDYTFIDDILDGVVQAIDRTAHPVAPCRIYNLGGSRVTTLKQLVERIEQALGKRATIDWQPEQPGDVPITNADLERSSAELSYAPQVPIEQGIARFVEWFRARNA
jgi:UDP-glucuronate 4-epimerase